MRKITQAVFPVAGIGSRFLPATKASPKEMLPIVEVGAAFTRHVQQLRA